MHTIESDPVLGIVSVHYEGSVGVGERAAVLEQLTSHLKHSGLRRLLISFCGAACAVDDFSNSNRLATRLACDAILRDCRIAYVVGAQCRMDPVVETLSVARGFVFQRFNDRDAALAWLTA